jgi:hypothetical protein
MEDALFDRRQPLAKGVTAVSTADAIRLATTIAAVADESNDRRLVGSWGATVTFDASQPSPPPPFRRMIMSSSGGFPFRARRQLDVRPNGYPDATRKGGFPLWTRPLPTPQSANETSGASTNGPY